MEPNSRDEIHQDWNLGASGESAGRTPRSAKPGASWDLTQDFRTPAAGPSGPSGPFGHFTLTPESADRAAPSVEPHDSFARGRKVVEGEPAGQGANEGPGRDGPIPFPNCGEGIGGFRLIDELGRGAFGRVYLAEESGLGNRSVALKVTRAEGDEPRLLARLQHTHIVPIHSVQDDPATGLRLMCMPYFGGANLAQVLAAAGGSQPGHTAGRSLVEALDILAKPTSSQAEASTAGDPDEPGLSATGHDQAAEPGPAARASSANASPLRSILDRIGFRARSSAAQSRTTARSGHAQAAADDRDPVEPARRFLREASGARASAWIVARLAEGLEHAHSRGLLHRDLKPSNILIAADGTPMLLDFNLAADAVSTGDAGRAMVGGTLPYMAPEHLDAFNPTGSTPPEAVDERSDIYSLGLILFEMIAGRPAFDEPPAGRPLLEVVRSMTSERRRACPSPRAVNPSIPLGLDAIVRKCLDADPNRRFARAGDFAEDLRRFLEDRPLKYTKEPSVRERVAKWARRNPMVTSGSTVGVIALVVVVLTAGVAWTASHHLRQVSARLRLRAFEPMLYECQFLLNTTSGPVEHLGRGIGLAERALEQAGLDLKSRRPRLDPWLDALPEADQLTMRTDLAEMILLVARARVAQAERLRSEEKRRKALEEGIARLDFAEKLDPRPPQALYDDRSRYHSALGNADLARLDRSRRDLTPPTTGRDFYLLGTALLARNQPDRAEAALLKAVGLDSRRFWSWFALGLCHYDQGRFTESAGDFTVCTVLAPRFAWPWMNRGLALARAGRLVEAREAYDRAIEVNRKFPEALANRGLTSLELGNASAAADDLSRAVELGRRDPEILAALAEAEYRSGHRAAAMEILARLIRDDPAAVMPRIARGTLLIEADEATARLDFRAVLDRDPKHPGAHLGMARLLRPTDPLAALREADQAVAGDPSRLDALELRAYLRGRMGQLSALADVELLATTPTPRRLYNAACAVAVLARAHPDDPTLEDRAIRLLRRAIDAGFPAGPAATDPDFEGIRPLPAFQGLLKPGG